MRRRRLTTHTRSAGAGSPALAFAWRPVLRPACHAHGVQTNECLFLGTGGPLQLPGFGVEMAIKNMEYSALDDSKVWSA